MEAELLLKTIKNTIAILPAIISSVSSIYVFSKRPINLQHENVWKLLYSLYLNVLENSRIMKTQNNFIRQLKTQEQLFKKIICLWAQNYILHSMIFISVKTNSYIENFILIWLEKQANSFGNVDYQSYQSNIDNSTKC